MFYKTHKKLLNLLFIFASFFVLFIFQNSHIDASNIDYANSEDSFLKLLNDSLPGDTILVDDITFTSQTISIKKGVTIKSVKDNNEKAIFNNASFILEGLLTSSTLNCSFEDIIFNGNIDVVNIKASDLLFYNEDGTVFPYNLNDYQYAFLFQGNTNIRFTNCDFTSYMYRYGSVFTADYTDSFKHCQLSITLNNCDFYSNASFFNGGVISLSGYEKNISLNSYNCNFKDNFTSAETIKSLANDDLVSYYSLVNRGGGAIFLENTVSSFMTCTFLNNEANYSYGDTLEIDDSKGGAISANNSNLSLINCVLAKNKACDGGALSLMRTTTLINGCVIAENRADTKIIDEGFTLGYLGNNGRGGAIYYPIWDPFEDPKYITIINTSIYNNHAKYAFGGICCAGYIDDLPLSELTLTSLYLVTYVDNTSDFEVNQNMLYNVFDIPSFYSFGSIISEEYFLRLELPNKNNHFNYYYENSPQELFLFKSLEYPHLLFPGNDIDFLVDSTSIKNLMIKELSNICGYIYVGDNACFYSNISLYSDGEKISDLLVEYGNIVNTVLTKKGYTFLGWSLQNGDLIETHNLLISGHDSYINLYASWKANNYLITFNVNGIENKLEQTYNSSWNTPSADLKGYSFNGWYTKENGNGELININDNYMIDENITLYAYFVKNPFPTYATILIVCSAVVFISLLIASVFIIRKRKLTDKGSLNNKSSKDQIDEKLDRLVFTYNLTAREKEIVSLLSEGKPPMVIAGELFISVETVKKHIKNVYEKLDIHKKYELLEKLKNI